MTVIPAFQIEGIHLNLTDSPWSNIKDLSAGQYDAFIKTQPDATLKYLDEDEDEVIVGSSAELLDRISEFQPGQRIVFQTINERGKGFWLSFLADRTAAQEQKNLPKAEEKKFSEQEPEQPKEATIPKEEEIKSETAEPEQSQTPEESDPFLAAFQRDLAQALRESLREPQCSSYQERVYVSGPEDIHPHPSVERFLRQLSETIQNSLQSVYPAATNVTTALRTNAALRQAAEVLQSVGHHANTAIHTDRKKIAEDLRDEVKVAMTNVGTALGEAFAEIGESYVQAYRQINHEVVKIINVTRGSGTSTPPAPETTTTEERTEEKEPVVEEKEPVVEEKQATEVNPDSELKRDLRPTVEEEKEVVSEKSTTSTTLLEETPNQETPSPALSELERALQRAEVQRLERLRTSPPMPGTFSQPEPLFPITSSSTTSSTVPPAPAPPAPAPRPFSNRFGSFAGAYARPQGRGQIFMNPPTTSHQWQSSTSTSTNQFHPTSSQTLTQSQIQIQKEEDQSAELTSFEAELMRGLEASLKEQHGETVVATEVEDNSKIDSCVAKLVDMGYDDVFDAERIRAVAVVAEGEVETAIAMLTGDYDD